MCGNITSRVSVDAYKFLCKSLQFFVSEINTSVWMRPSFHPESSTKRRMVSTS